MNNDSKILFFFTSSYPFEKGETFIENEIYYLEKAFDKIILICSSKENALSNRYLPQNATIYSFNEKLTINNKISSLLNIFSIIFFKELFTIRFKYHKSINIKILKIILLEFQKAKLLKSFVIKILNSILIEKPNFYMYSYWNDYKALCISLLKQQCNSSLSISRAHGWDIYFERHKENYLPFKNYIFRQIDITFFISENGLKAGLKLINKQSHNKFQLSRLGTNNKYLPKDFIYQEKIVLVSCSNVISLKRINYIIEALSLIHDINITWIHFGEGEDFVKITNLAETLLKNKKNINYTLYGHATNQLILEHYNSNQIDLLINVSETEGIPVSMMEAMSFGIPCIGTNVGGVSEIIENGFNGFLLQSNPTYSEIAETIRTYYKLTLSEKLILRENSYSTWKNKYNAEKNYTNFIKTFFLT